MLNKKLFASVATQEKWNTLKISTGVSDDHYVIGEGEATAGVPDIEWNWVVFIQDVKKIWNRGIFYSDNELAKVSIDKEETGSLVVELENGVVVGSDINLIQQYVDNKFITDGEIEVTDDAARAIMGGDWRTPTPEEWDTLFKLSFSYPGGAGGTATVGGILEFPCGTTDNNSTYWTNKVYDVNDRAWVYYFNTLDSNKHRPMFSVQSRRSTMLIRGVCPIGGNTNGHDYVDLGTGILWATKNVGATDSNPIGSQFKWGEIEPSTSGGYETYKWSEGGNGNNYGTLTKYVLSSSLGTIDNKEYLELSYKVPVSGVNKYYTYQECDDKFQPKGDYQTRGDYASTTDITNIIEQINSLSGDIDDTARNLWGGDWRMPTKAEVEELLTYAKNNITKLEIIFSDSLPYNYLVVSNNLVFPDGGYQRYIASAPAQKSLKWYIPTSERKTSTQVYVGRMDLIDFEDQKVLDLDAKLSTSDTEIRRDTAYPIRPVCDPGGNLNGHAGVDIGLPSGLIWATMNIGATDPTEVGNYYTWGDQQPTYRRNASTYYDKDTGSYTKYNNKDGLTRLSLIGGRFYTKSESDSKFALKSEISNSLEISEESTNYLHIFEDKLSALTSTLASVQLTQNSNGVYEESEDNEEKGLAIAVDVAAVIANKELVLNDLNERVAALEQAEPAPSTLSEDYAPSNADDMVPAAGDLLETAISKLDTKTIELEKAHYLSEDYTHEEDEFNLTINPGDSIQTAISKLDAAINYLLPGIETMLREIIGED